MPTIYFTEEGTYGDATELHFVHSDELTQEDFTLLSECSDSKRLELAYVLHMRNIIKASDANADLPCLRCIVTPEPDTDSGYVWITCTADHITGEGDGCNWGNI